MQIRVGQGIDIHRFVRQRKFILGGVDIPYEMGLDGHSDADALLHAITDALLGASGNNDIGNFFPDTDQQWKDADSLQLLAQIWQKVIKPKWKICNVDSTILLEAPKIAKYTLQMRQNIAQTLETEIDSITIKATTTEKLGYVGQGQGIWVSSVALLQKI